MNTTRSSLENYGDESPRGSLVAMLQFASDDDAIFVFDLANETFTTVHRHQDDKLATIVSENLVMLTDAKTNLQAWQIAPHPRHRILCLTTIKKLIAKHHHETLNLPTFSSPAEALPWLVTTAHEAFDRITKLDMASLSSLEGRVITAVMAMEQRGVPFKKSAWQHALADIEHETSRLKARLDEILPNDNGFLLFGQQPVDLNNANAVKTALEKILGTKLSGTSQSSLKDYDHEAVKLILRYREQARMLSNYGETFLAKIHDERLRGHFTPIGSASGRFACHDTNLLALPGERVFQSCMVPEHPYVVTHFDYGAFELRILAALSGDQTLIRIFNDDQDIHAMVAQEIFNVTVSKTENAHLRDQAKCLNFGLIYGMGETALAKQLKITKDDAHALLSNYFKRFHVVGDYLSSQETMAKTTGFVKTVLGRRAYFVDVEDQGLVARLARNIPIQGTGADIAKLALCRVYHRLHEDGLDAHVINLVHDELVVESHCDHQAHVEALVVEEMSSAFTALCPAVPAAVSAC